MKKLRGFVPSLPTDAVASAKAANCRYVDDSEPGIRRLRQGRGFRYVDAGGKTVRDATVLARIRSLVIPPAWTNVWVCASANGHIQATGRDARGRKQYRYHPRFREIRDETKYERMLAFAAALPAIRARVDEHLSLPGLARERVLATVVRLLELTLIRVGNEEYARDNGSFGLTTLRSRHVNVVGSTVVFRFRGKSGKLHRVEATDRRLARVISRCTDLPGEVLFRFEDESGELQAVESAEVNEYLRSIADADITAKDFRTWAGTVLAAEELLSLVPPAKKHLTAAVKRVAERLGNTASVCRKCYVHPEILSAYLDGQLATQPRSAHPTLSSIEAAVVALLHTRAAARPGPKERAA